MTRNNPTAGEVYRHFRGRCYRILHIAIATETKEKVVVYQPLEGDGRVYTSLLERFMETVDPEKYGETGQKYRFERVDTEDVLDDLEILERAHQQAVEKAKEEPERSEAEEQHAMILEFLDLDTIGDKIQYLQKNRLKFKERFLTAAAESLEYAEREETIEERYAGILRFLRTKERYESGRLR